MSLLKKGNISKIYILFLISFKMTNKIPPQLELPDTIFRSIRNGSRGIVFKIAEDLAAKILYEGNCFNDTENFRIRNDPDALEKLQYEAEIANFLYDLDHNIPRPIGIEKFSIFPNSNVTYPAFIMEYLPFSSGAELNDLELNKARELAKDEIVKTLDFGFMPGDDALNPNNFLYDRDNEKSYLIDFEFWSYDNGNTICLTPKNTGDNQF